MQLVEKKLYFTKEDKEPVLLIGRHKPSGENLYLRFPKWDCDWYWGFGYIAKFNRYPSNSKQRSHSHIDGYVKVSENEFETCVLNKDEYWHLIELVRQFYLLKEMAEFCHHKPIPGCNVVLGPIVNHSNSVKGWYTMLNTVMIPKVMLAIVSMLLPKDDEKSTKALEHFHHQELLCYKKLLPKEIYEKLKVEQQDFNLDNLLRGNSREL